MELVKRKTGEPYLKLYLSPETSVVLALHQAQEVITVPTKKLTVMPNVNPVYLGLLNQRSRVIWVIDLGQLLGLEPLSAERATLAIALMKMGRTTLGLAVEQIQGVVRLNRETIQSPIGTVSAGLTPYLLGCTLTDGKVLLILDPEAIINSPVLRTI